MIHNEIRDLKAELLDMVCYGVAIEPTFQPLAGEELNRGANTALDERLNALLWILGETTGCLFELFFVKKYLLVGAWGMSWAGGSVVQWFNGSVDQ